MDQDAHDDLGARLLLLADEVGDPEVVGQALQLFLANLPGLVDEIAGSAETTLRHAAAHRLAGSAETLGATRLGARCRAVMATSEHDAAMAAQVRAAADDAAQVMRLLLPSFEGSS